MGIRVVTLKDHHYGERRKVGDAYEVPGQSVLALVKAMGWAKEEATAAPAPAPLPIETAALTAARATPAAKKTAGRRSAGSYLTRDMTAQAPASAALAPPPSSDSTDAAAAPPPAEAPASTAADTPPAE